MSRIVPSRGRLRSWSPSSRRASAVPTSTAYRRERPQASRAGDGARDRGSSPDARSGTGRRWRWRARDHQPRAVVRRLRRLSSGSGAELPEPQRDRRALVEPLAVGYHAAVRGGCSDADRVLVLGAGPIGQACVLAAQRLGANRVVVSDPNPARRELCGSLGAAPLDPAGGNLTKAVAHALSGPATLVIDAVGIQASLTDAMSASSLGARIVLVGMGPHGWRFQRTQSAPTSAPSSGASATHERTSTTQPDGSRAPTTTCHASTKAGSVGTERDRASRISVAASARPARCWSFPAERRSATEPSRGNTVWPRSCHPPP